MALGSIPNTTINEYKWKKPFYYHALKKVSELAFSSLGMRSEDTGREKTNQTIPLDFTLWKPVKCDGSQI